MIRIEDNFEDVIGKAMKGLGLNIEQLAKTAQLNPKRVESLLEGTLLEDALLAVAPPLNLAPEKLLSMARGEWRPDLTLPHIVSLFNTKFPVPGYEEMTVNSYLISDGTSAIAVDTGANAEALLTQLKEQKLKLESVCVTHTHRDHIAALDTIKKAHPDAVIYCPEAELITGAIPIKHGSEIACGKLRLETRETSGHSKGGLSFILLDQKTPLAFVGDAIFSLSMGKAPKEVYAKALEHNRSRLLSLPDETVLCPGHGPVTTVGDEKKRNPFF